MSPTPGMRCQCCGCCDADITVPLVGEEDLLLCWACDAGDNCANKKKPTEEKQPAELPIVNTDEKTPLAPEQNRSQPTPGEDTMATRLCKGGCGKALPAANKNGYAYGHSTGCTAAPAAPITTEEVFVGTEPEEDEVQLNLTEEMLNRIWHSLPIEEKGLAIQTALTAGRA